MRVLSLSALVTLAASAGAQAQTMAAEPVPGVVYDPPLATPVGWADAAAYAAPAVWTPTPAPVEAAAYAAPVYAAPVYAEPVYEPAPFYASSSVVTPAALIAPVPVLAAPVAAAAPVHGGGYGGWSASGYVELGGGASLPQGALRDRAENGFAIQGGLGAVLQGPGVGPNDRIRIGVEGVHARHEAKIADGRATVQGAFLTAEYEMDLGGPVRPYLGAGVGAARVDLGDGPRGFESETALAFKATAGLSLDLTPNLQAYGEYSYLAANDVEYRRPTGSGVKSFGETDLNSHLVTVGLRYNF